MDNKQLYFEELGWVEAGVGTVIGIGIVVYVAVT